MRTLNDVANRLTNKVDNDKFDGGAGHIFITKLEPSKFFHYFDAEDNRVFLTPEEEATWGNKSQLFRLEFQVITGFDKDGKPVLGDTKVTSITERGIKNKPQYAPSMFIGGWYGYGDFVVCTAKEDRTGANGELTLKAGEEYVKFYRLDFTIDNDEIRNKTFNIRQF